MTYVLPILLLLTLIYAAVKRVSAYDAFVLGAKNGLETTLSVLPYLVATFVLVELFRQSGLSSVVVGWLAPVFDFFGIPPELVELCLLRPFSGSGSLALLADVYSTYGADGYVARAASVVMGSSETVFYVSAVYFAKTNVKRLGLAVPIALFCSFLGCVLSCLLCRFI